ncbi:MAG TPA: N-6 DNA methylase [Gemmataceae bacterium]|nr:N-6 DNA methylase [Gemmataceae bacterium]
MATIEPGHIQVAPVAFEDVPVQWTPYTPNSVDGRTLFSKLVNGVVDWDDDISRGDDVFERLRVLLMHSASQLAQMQISRPDVLSLLGRALFFRFLTDRQIITEDNIPHVAPGARTWHDCFDGPANAAATCRWLDDTFNGDFLPLAGGGGEKYFRQIDRATNGEVFRHLMAVVLGGEPRGASYQLLLKWESIDFAHVPVGLLSQVYEDFCWHWEQAEAASTSVHYTPRNIAVTLLDEAFHALADADEAKVLDPACGACVFLVLAFRRIYREVWKRKGRRPDRRTIRRILDRQLTGFDVSEDALRLGALSLYLTALELDPRPQPLSELKFDDLRGRVLFNVRRAGEDLPTGAVVGSIGDAVGAEHNGQYDIVLSNPPWTSVPAPVGQAMEAAARAVLARAGARDADRYRNPDFNPDLPLLIRSTEWCKKGGRIAMALPARLLLKNKPIPTEARNRIFRLIDVTGIISGVHLAKTRVWPGTDQPFILLFARNETAGEDPRTQVVCPHYDSELNHRGDFRIDSDASVLVNAQEAEAEPWMWKGWLVGSFLDVAIVRKLLANPAAIRVSDYWHEFSLAEGQGCIVSEDNTTQYDARHLRGLPFLPASETPGFVVNVSRLDRFRRATLHMRRSRDIYYSPLVLLKQSPGTDRAKGFGYLAFDDVVYVSSYYGYSTRGHPKAELLARYLHLLIHSDIWLHFGLITGAQFGAERNKLQKQSIEDFPLVRLEALNADQTRTIARLSQRLVAGDSEVFDAIDKLFARIHGLTTADLDVIRDSLDVGQAYRESSGTRACAPPTTTECRRFVERLRNLLAPFLEIDESAVRATLWVPDGASRADQTFGAIVFGKAPDQLDDKIYREVVPLADNTGASRIVMTQTGGGMLVGLRNQYRYWTTTRARILAADIIRDHLDALTQ